MEEKENYGIKDKPCNNSSSKEADLNSMHKTNEHNYEENRIQIFLYIELQDRQVF
jgi:hypothetical protein